MSTVGWFVTPHGFGHAARACAIAEALAQHDPCLRLEIWTAAAEHFFDDSLSTPFVYHRDVNDVGLVQRTSLAEDLPATVRELDRLLPLDPRRVEALAAAVTARGCEVLVCDIAPLGIAVAQRAGIPSVLVENFTWDWIYAGYLDAEPRLAPFLAPLRDLFSAATLRLQTAPVCRPAAGAVAVAPVARAPRRDPDAVRAALGLAGDSRPLVLLTMGGVEWSYGTLDAYRRHDELVFVVPGGGAVECREGNLVLLPHRSSHFHPDLVAAADLVVGKLGYSTVAEAWSAGTRFAYVPRPAFRESAVLEQFVEAELPALEIDAAELASGAWLGRAAPLLARPRPSRELHAGGGAAQAAAAIVALLERTPARRPA